MLYNKAIGATASAQKIYIEDVFSTFLYTGNDSTQTITNGIDLAGEGGLVWLKARAGTNATDYHYLTDTARGNGFSSASNVNDAQYATPRISSFNTNGFTLGAYSTNNSSTTYTSWTFRKAAKFFDVVTYTGNGTAGRSISHNLGSVPGCIIVKNLSSISNWAVYHRSSNASPATGGLLLNLTNAFTVSSPLWNDTQPTSTNFTVGTSVNTNTNGDTYVAYLFAHDAGGFGDSGNDNVISCGSYTGNGTSPGPTVNLGWEPQWVLIKNATTGGQDYLGWAVFDNMRGVATNGNDSILMANSSAAENTGSNPAYPYIDFTSTGFNLDTGASAQTNQNGNTYIYIAIRRGPMKTPTDATKVFNAITAFGVSNTVRTVGFLADAALTRARDITSVGFWQDRVRGFNETSSVASFNRQFKFPVDTAAEYQDYSAHYNVWNTTAKDAEQVDVKNFIAYFFGRAPGFFDVVAYAGPGGGTIQHNLGIKPQLIIVKNRGSIAEWAVYAEAVGATQYAKLHLTDAFSTNSTWLNTEPTASVFSVSANARAGASGNNYIAYLFATCPGVSKVGSYTGTGTTQQINCGFTNGARFVLIKRTDSTGNWYVWDTARGIVSANDPYLLLNSTAAEVTNTDYIDPLSSGFEISSTAPAAINASGGSYIFLAIA